MTQTRRQGRLPSLIDRLHPSPRLRWQQPCSTQADPPRMFHYHFGHPIPPQPLAASWRRSSLSKSLSRSCLSSGNYPSSERISAWKKAKHPSRQLYSTRMTSAPSNSAQPPTQHKRNTKNTTTKNKKDNQTQHGI